MTNELALSLFTGFIIELIVLGISDKGKRTWVLIIGSILALAFALYPLFLSPKPPNQPYVLIKNHLVLPIKITVDNELRGIVKGEDERYFLLDSYPAPVKWHIIRLKNDTGQETGVNFAGAFTASNGNSTLVIDNKITSKSYFILNIKNKRNENCHIVIDDGYDGEIEAGVLLPKATNVVSGYFPFFSNSNVVLYCKTKTLWWGIRRNRDDNKTTLGELMESRTGVIQIIVR